MTISVNNNKVTLTCNNAATKAVINVIDVVDNVCGTYITRYSYDLPKQETTVETYTYELDLTKRSDISAFIVTTYNDNTEQETASYFDLKELYYKEIELLTTHCNTCLDKLQKEKIMLFMLKYQLFQYATDNNLIEDQIKYYKDLIKMTNINVKPNTQAICSSTKNVCCNGVCELC